MEKSIFESKKLLLTEESSQELSQISSNNKQNSPTHNSQKQPSTKDTAHLNKSASSTQNIKPVSENADQSETQVEQINVNSDSKTGELSLQNSFQESQKLNISIQGGKISFCLTQTENLIEVTFKEEGKKELKGRKKGNFALESKIFVKEEKIFIRTSEFEAVLLKQLCFLSRNMFSDKK